MEKPYLSWENPLVSCRLTDASDLFLLEGLCNAELRTQSTCTDFGLLQQARSPILASGPPDGKASCRMPSHAIIAFISNYAKIW